MLKLLSLLIAGAAFVLQTAQAVQATPPDREPHDVTLCDLAKDPAAQNHELVRLTGFVTHGFEDFSLADPNCSAANFSVWLTYGGKMQSNTMYCCPGEASKPLRIKTLVVEGIEVPLVSDSVFEEFTALLNKEGDTTIRATVVGVFFSGKRTFNGVTYPGGGFGHMGCCSLLAIERVQNFAPHTRTDMDYSSTAGWYEDGGCGDGGIRYLKHVSVSDVGKEREEAITEQQMADSGARVWAFDHPEVVASESLKVLYKSKKQILGLQKLSETPSRAIFRWNHRGPATVVVVTRPYWLSFYAKSTHVVWVSTTIKEKEECG